MTAHIKWMKTEPVTDKVIQEIVDAVVYHKQSTGNFVAPCYGIFSDGDIAIYNLGRMLNSNQQPEDFLPKDFEDREILLDIFNRCLPKVLFQF